jgi:cysteine desulfurase
MIYLDHNATTPVLPEVLDTMLPFFCGEWGNPSSSYRFGSRVKKAIETAREQVAELIGAHPLEVVFTSGGTESDNTALHAMLRADSAKRHIITSEVEHSAVLAFCRELEKTGFRLTYPLPRACGCLNDSLGVAVMK